MLRIFYPAVMVMLWLPPAPAEENPWKAKVADAVQRAEADSSPAALREAFDTVWRADDWLAGLHLATRVLGEPRRVDELRPLIVRALWRAGRIEQAEELAAPLDAATADRVTLRVLIEMHLARGDVEKAERWADRLCGLDALTAEDLYLIFAARFSAQRLADLPALLRRAERLTDARHGYPETHLSEAIEGLADFLEAVGPAPLNEVAEYGAAPMPPLVMFNLPSCDVWINGRGPYRMVVDTGGSIMIALDEQVAAEIGLKSVAKASVRGVSGRTETGQALIDDLRIGSIRCRRVVTRIFDVRGAIMNAADGIVGTGIFGSARMTLDFAAGQLVVARSGPEAAAGASVSLRVVADAKLVVPVRMENEPALALLDTGADVVAVAPSRLRLLFPDRKVQTFRPGVAIGVGSDQAPSVSLGSGVRLTFGGRTYANYGGVGLDVLDEILGPVLGVQSDILLGMPTFRDMRSCTVDFPTSRMWIDWLDRSNPPATQPAPTESRP